MERRPIRLGRHSIHIKFLSGFVHFISALRMPLADLCRSLSTRVGVRSKANQHLNAVRTCSYKSFLRDFRRDPVWQETGLEQLEDFSMRRKERHEVDWISRRQWDLKAFGTSPLRHPLRPRQKLPTHDRSPKESPIGRVIRVYSKKK